MGGASAGPSGSRVWTHPTSSRYVSEDLGRRNSFLNNVHATLSLEVDVTYTVEEGVRWLEA